MAATCLIRMPSRITIKKRVLVIVMALASGCAGGLACRDWTSQVRTLTAAQRAELDSYGARAVNSRILFSARVVADCELRGQFSRFAGAIIRGKAADEGDSTAVRQNARQFVAALVAIWPTRDRHLPGSDGAFRDEMATLLVVPEVARTVMRPLIAQILRDDGVTGEVAYALMTRPDALFLAHVRAATSARCPVREQILALAVLQCLGEDTRARLIDIERRVTLTHAMQQTLRVLLERQTERRPPQWNDVLDVAAE